MSTKRISYIITDSNITCNYDGQTHIVKRSDALADKLIKAIKDGKTDLIPELVSVAKRIDKFSNGTFQVKNGRVQVNGVDAPQVLSDKIVRFSNEGLPFQPLLKFAENLQANPSYRAVQELYGFLEKNNHPITESGTLIAYRRVKQNLTDIYTGKFDNSPGQVLEMPRNMVDEDCDRTCSNGFHASSWEYCFKHYGSDNRDTDIFLEVEINPADVVAVPTDYENSKLRVCKYKVLGVIDAPHDETVSLRRTENERDTKKFDIDEPSYCEVCDTECDAGDGYCAECGALLPADECEDCGELIDERICGLCDDCGEETDRCICDVCEDCDEPMNNCMCDQECSVCFLPLPDTDVKHGYTTCWDCRVNNPPKRPSHDEYPYQLPPREGDGLFLP